MFYIVWISTLNISWFDISDYLDISKLSWGSEFLFFLDTLSLKCYLSGTNSYFMKIIQYISLLSGFKTIPVGSGASLKKSTKYGSWCISLAAAEPHSSSATYKHTNKTKKILVKCPAEQDAIVKQGCPWWQHSQNVAKSLNLHFDTGPPSGAYDVSEVWVTLGRVGRDMMSVKCE